MRPISISIILLFILPAFIYGQASDKKLVQLSGIIHATNKNPVPFATVKIKNTFRGTIAGVDGFYSLVAGEKDTIIYEALGHKEVQFVIPENNTDQKLIHNIIMPNDTITYEETVIYPWPTKEEFREAFLSLKDKNTYAALARKNMDQSKLQTLYENMARDGQEEQLRMLQGLANSYYYAGGQTNYSFIGNGVAVPVSLLNPFAWAQFIKDLRAGKFKKKNNEK